MRIRFAVLSLMLIAVSSPALRAQSSTIGDFVSRTEASVMYNYVRSNDTPQPTGQATGFSLSGLSAAGAYQFRPRLSAVVDLGGTHVNGVGGTGESLTMLTYLFGARYSVLPKFHIKPFGQVLLGGVHAYGGIYPANAVTSGGADSFAMTAGAGADYALNPHISLRGQLDYLYTALPNGSSNRQNDLRAGGGIVAHFGSR